MMVRRQFYILFLYLLLFSSFPLRASTFIEEEAIKRGLNIYLSLSRKWVQSREEIAKDGLSPFLATLERANAAAEISHGEKEARRKMLFAYVEKEAPNINKTLILQMNISLNTYGRSSLFSTLNILNADAFFKVLGTLYQRPEFFINDILTNHVTAHQDLYTFTYRCCVIINPEFEHVLKENLLGASKVKTNSPFYDLALDLLWYEPYQLLSLALNTHLETLFENANTTTSSYFS